MATRKPVKKARRASAAKTGAGRKTARKAAKAGRKAAARKKPAGRKTTRRAAKPAARKRTRRVAKPAVRKTARRAAKPASRKRAAPRAVARPAAKKTARRKPARTAAARPAPRKPAPARRRPPAGRKVPRLDRERWRVRDDDTVTGPPSVAGSDRPSPPGHEPYDRPAAHGSTRPTIAGGDFDADWESAASVGDAAPGGDHPTPDQDVVDEIGRSVGVQFEGGETLKVEDKVAERDRHRGELDPGSSDDFDER